LGVKRFKKILYVDGRTQNPQALRRAVELAEQNRASLEILEVLEEIPRHVRGRSGAAVDIKRIVVRDMEERLQAFIGRIPGAERTPIKTKLVFGTPFIEIIREVLRAGHDLVMMGTEQEDGLRERIFGTTVMHLMRKCPCPLWVIRPRRGRKFARILAAVAPAEGAASKEALNDTIMTLATSLARMEKSPLHVVHCWTEPYESLLKRQVGAETAKQLVRETKDTHQEWLDALLARHPADDLQRHAHLLKGDPGLRIPELAKKRGVDLVIMGSVSRTGIKGFLIGNTAEKVMNELHCSIMTVKPEGFVTPVTLGG
jgi:universal stress protein E